MSAIPARQDTGARNRRRNLRHRADCDMTLVSGQFGFGVRNWSFGGFSAVCHPGGFRPGQKILLEELRLCRDGEESRAPFFATCQVIRVIPPGGGFAAAFTRMDDASFRLLERLLRYRRI